ncbi:hypothetical protein [Patulibacter sp.]|uniref:hypothetical protein n=1 Tax=Patulibacter sp. TaxID=1912859 RepID=UPI0027210B5D|nr:hypothetical protein [Patulibacter sp.]MDO9409945.1 hypothetical protein [Patulibacter sp.]
MSAWFDVYGCDLVRDGLLVGAVPRDVDDVAVLRGQGVSRVVCLVADEEYEPGDRRAVEAAYAAARIVESRVPSQDFGRLPAAALEASSALVADALDGGATVYLHCRAGWQRSVVTAAASLSRVTGDPPAATLAAVTAARRGACPLPHQVDDLETWWAGR